MDALTQLLDILLHVDVYLLEIAEVHGRWVYAILFAIVFCETGMVITPFLPGDSLLFAAGTLVAMGVLAPGTVLITIVTAAVLGDALNYSVGRFIGERAHQARLINQQHLRRTEAFFNRHGGRAIVIARFVPIVRTFAPFTAGICAMAYRRFAFYNVFGALLWVGLLVPAGWAFGNIPAVRDNLTLVMLAIVVASVAVPAVEHACRKARSRRLTSADPTMPPISQTDLQP